MRQLQKNQQSRLMTIHIDGTPPTLIFETDMLIEAPNWTPDDRFLIFNAEGSLYKIEIASPGEPSKIPVENVHSFNNDHVISPDGQYLYGSASGHIYELPIHGGVARKVSNDHADRQCFQYFLHGISPDGRQLSYVAVESNGQDPFGIQRIATLDLDTGIDRFHTSATSSADGPEYSPDNRWIYFNMSSDPATDPAHQIYRLSTENGVVEQMTSDERSNWFPHISPDGKWMAYISYRPGTIGHPADRHILIKLMSLTGGDTKILASTFGGQGTMNVNSWSSDSSRLAYVAFPVVENTERDVGSL